MQLFLNRKKQNPFNLKYFDLLIYHYAIFAGLHTLIINI